MTVPLLLKASQVAIQLGVSKSTLHRWVKAGKIECVRVERNSVYFTREAIETFIDKHRKCYTASKVRLQPYAFRV